MGMSMSGNGPGFAFFAFAAALRGFLAATTPSIELSAVAFTFRAMAGCRATTGTRSKAGDGRGARDVGTRRHGDIVMRQSCDRVFREWSQRVMRV